MPTFRNPVTDTVYRLVHALGEAFWRTTKVRTDHGIVTLRHLHGTRSSTIANDHAIDLLVRGSRGIPRVHGDL